MKVCMERFSLCAAHSSVRLTFISWYFQGGSPAGSMSGSAPWAASAPVLQSAAKTGQEIAAAVSEVGDYTVSALFDTFHAFSS